MLQYVTVVTSRLWRWGERTFLVLFFQLSCIFPVYLQNIIKIALNAKKISAAALSLPVPGGTNLRASRAQTERVLDGNSNG